jgi:uncharacterized protein YrrD
VSDGESLIAWPALQTGAPVYSSDGHELGTVGDVVADRQKDIFSGIVIDPGLLKEKVFAPADAVAEITEVGVTLNLTAAQADRDLGPPPA